jgi:type IV secretory pathway VirB4 component
MSNSQQEIQRLAEALYSTRQQIKELEKTEEALVKELKEFTDEGEDTTTITNENGKVVVVEYGKKKIVKSNIEPQELYKLSVKLNMEDAFWRSVTVGLGKAKELFPAMQLEKITGYNETSTWKISYK